ncbi:MAG: 1-acyl-sn-glycerol-3-phosphate acyltransferase [Myxococcota bacterium]|jgi:1-acyl-sn-glycerol-3-phosphate acyltransferase
MKPWFRTLAGQYARRKLKKSLDGVYVGGLEAACAFRKHSPVLLAANHVAWWDALLLLPLDDALGGSGRAVMDAENLSRLPFFGWLGALPLDRSSPARSRKGLRTAADHLQQPGSAVWIFPQGEQRPAWIRPLALQRGVQLLSRLSKAPILPVSIQYGFREHANPTAVVDFGPPIPDDVSDPMAALEAALCDGLSRIDDFFLGRSTRYTPLIPPVSRRSEDGLGSRLLTMNRSAK